ncbi:MAG: hypothetical protein LBV67_05850 [Streptococcaceae bacterium]|nr:hypothetical protein [Streptococcaceae bacterium]
MKFRELFYGFINKGIEPAYNYVLSTKEQFTDEELKKLSKLDVKWFSMNSKTCKFYSQKNKENLINEINRLNINPFMLFKINEFSALRTLN